MRSIVGFEHREQWRVDKEMNRTMADPLHLGCGEGVLDWERIIAIVKAKCPRDIVFSVECGSPAQAAKSLEHLNRLVA